jgi:hypothetical protein
VTRLIGEMKLTCRKRFCGNAAQQQDPGSLWFTLYPVEWVDVGLLKSWVKRGVDPFYDALHMWFGIYCTMSYNGIEI